MKKAGIRKAYKPPRMSIVDMCGAGIIAASTLTFDNAGNGEAGLYDEEYNGEGLVKGNTGPFDSQQWDLGIK